MVRMRAMENHRWLLRATNTGVTAVIDPLGRVTGEMPRHVRGALAVNFGYESDETFYTRYGDWIGWMCAVVAVGMLGWSFARRSDVH
jgi:apolipoprotein N-acyltransferase